MVNLHLGSPTELSCHCSSFIPLGQISILDHFSSTRRIFFNISIRVEFLMRTLSVFVWKYLYLLLAFERYFDWILKPRWAVIFYWHFKDVISSFSGFHCFFGKFSCLVIAPLKVINHFFFLATLKIFFFFCLSRLSAVLLWYA